MQPPLKSGKLQHDNPSLGHPLRAMVKGNPLSSQNLEQCTCSHCLEGEMASCATDSWAVNNGLAGWSGTQRKHDWKIGDKEIFKKQKNKNNNNY